MSFSKKVGYGLMMTGLFGNAGCAKDALLEPVGADTPDHGSHCDVVEKDKQRPEPVCGLQNIKDSVGTAVRLGMAMVECTNSENSIRETTRVNVSCESPLWVANQEGDGMESVCLHYTGCEKGHLVIRPDLENENSWELRQ